VAERELQSCANYCPRRVGQVPLGTTQTQVPIPKGTRLTVEEIILTTPARGPTTDSTPSSTSTYHLIS